ALPRHHARPPAARLRAADLLPRGAAAHHCLVRASAPAPLKWAGVKLLDTRDPRAPVADGWPPTRPGRRRAAGVHRERPSWSTGRARTWPGFCVTLPRTQGVEGTC